ncbi:hypothetical protein JCM3263A_29320 [Thermobifida fusca]
MTATLGKYGAEHFAEQPDVAAKLVGHLLAGAVACHGTDDTQIGLLHLNVGVFFLSRSVGTSSDKHENCYHQKKSRGDGMCQVKDPRTDTTDE